MAVDYPMAKDVNQLIASICGRTRSCMRFEAIMKTATVDQLYAAAGWTILTPGAHQQPFLSIIATELVGRGVELSATPPILLELQKKR